MNFDGKVNPWYMSNSDLGESAIRACFVVKAKMMLTALTVFVKERRMSSELSTIQ
jgi:hypothetical protein